MAPDVLMSNILLYHSENSPWLSYAPFLIMSNLRDSFSFMAIVKVLATLRAKAAVVRHRSQFEWRFFSDAQKELHVHDWRGGVECLLPPRRQWSRPKSKQRGGGKVPKERILCDSIYRKVHGIFVAGKIDSVEWGRRLQTFVNEVQQRIEHNRLTFHEPRLWLRKKSRSDKERCISSYEDLSDYVILAITNKYLSSLIDPMLSKDSYAFRTSVKQTYNKAMSNLVRFRRHFDGALWVVNCDLKKLFDVINHTVIIKLLRCRMERLDVDEKALAVVHGYLNSYSYKMVDEKFGRSEKIDTPDWEQIRTLHGNRPLDMCQFGIPQGGAISGVLANLVLDEVDQAILRMQDNDLFYARYCDDIILVHPNYDRCRSALDICLEKLHELKLPIHEIMRTPRYGAEFYLVKSKGPYVWNDPRQHSAIPWVPFLGYNVRFDGNVRVRKETISRHVDSLKTEFLDFIHRLCSMRLRQGISRENVVVAFLYRVIRKSIGSRYAGSAHEIGCCWLSAFRNVWLSPPALRQLKNLDKKLMSLISLLLGGLGLKMSHAHIGRMFNHVATARSVNKRKRRNDIAFGLEQLGNDEKLREELPAKYHKREWIMIRKDDSIFRNDYDYWPDDDYDGDRYYVNTVVIS